MKKSTPPLQGKVDSVIQQTHSPLRNNNSEEKSQQFLH
jgi:hypothetical protein